MMKSLLAARAAPGTNEDVRSTARFGSPRTIPRNRRLSGTQTNTRWPLLSGPPAATQSDTPPSLGIRVSCPGRPPIYQPLPLALAGPLFPQIPKSPTFSSSRRSRRRPAYGPIPPIVAAATRSSRTPTCPGCRRGRR
jgi:hypothetical protein